MSRSGNHQKSRIVFPRESFKIKGISNYQFDKSKITRETLLTMESEPNNKYDKDAIRILFEGKTIGYVPKEDKFIKHMRTHHINEKLRVINTGIAETGVMGIRVMPNFLYDFKKY